MGNVNKKSRAWLEFNLPHLFNVCSQGPTQTVWPFVVLKLKEMYGYYRNVPINMKNCKEYLHLSSN